MSFRRRPAVFRLSGNRQRNYLWCLFCGRRVSKPYGAGTYFLCRPSAARIAYQQTAKAALIHIAGDIEKEAVSDAITSTEEQTAAISGTSKAIRP